MWETLTIWFQYLMANPSTATLLVGGLLFLALFLALQLTRWGQENPVSKCVALSVFAHVILLVYAYTTNLITHVPVAKLPDPVPIQLAEAPLESNPGAEAGTSEQRPFWEQFKAESVEPEPDFAAVQALETNLEISDNLPATRLPQWESPQAEKSDPTHLLQQPTTEDLVLQNVVEQTLQPREHEIHRPPTYQTPVASHQDPAVSRTDNPMRSPEARKVDEHQWMADQLGTNGPERINSNSDSFDWSPDQLARKAEELRQAEWDATPAVDSTQNRVEQLVQSAKQRSTEIDPTSVGRSNPIEHQPQLPRQPINTSPNSNGRRRLGDGKALPIRYAQRQEHSMEWLEKQGGSSETELAIGRALAYLASVQQEDGSWNPRTTDAGRELQVLGHNRQGAGAQADTGITGLAILAFLGAGNTHLEGGYRENVRRGLEYLMGRQQRSGSMAGSSQFFAQMYCHSMALLAVSEAYSMTGDSRLGDAVKRGVAYSEQAQNKTVGGWRYQPGDSGDMSQFGWQVMALNSAALNGHRLSAETDNLMVAFLQRHTQGKHQGLAHYRYGEDVSPVMTAEAMFCRYLLRQSVSLQAAQEAAREILGDADANGKPSHLPGAGVDNVYFWYYGTLALHQLAVDSRFASDPEIQRAWQDWNQHLTKRLLHLQESKGSAEFGSWDSKWFMWGCYGGRVYSTAMSTMCLQVYYRYDLAAEERLRTAGVPSVSAGRSRDGLGGSFNDRPVLPVR